MRVQLPLFNLLNIGSNLSLRQIDLSYTQRDDTTTTMIYLSLLAKIFPRVPDLRDLLVSLLPRKARQARLLLVRVANLVHCILRNRFLQKYTCYRYQTCSVLFRIDFATELKDRNMQNHIRSGLYMWVEQSRTGCQHGPTCVFFEKTSIFFWQ